MEFFDINYLRELANDYVFPFAINLLLAFLIFYGGRLVARLVVKAVGKLLERAKIEQSLTKFLCDLAYALLLAVVVIAALDRVGVKTTAAIAVIGAAGLAVGLALQGSLGNFAAGVMIILFKPYRLGDLVKLSGHTGNVEAISIFNTVLVTLDNRKIIIPNGNITGNTIENISTLGTIRVDMIFGIGYGEDIDKAKTILQDILRDDSRVLEDPAPCVAVSELAESSVNFVVRPFVHPDHYWDVMFDVTEQVKKRFDDNDISIPFPQRDIHVYNQKTGLKAA